MIVKGAWGKRGGAAVARILPAAVLAGVIGACGIFDSGLDVPEAATILLEGPPGASVVLVTSTGLLTSGDTNEDGSFDIEFESADTLVVTLPYQAAYAIEEREGQRNFYAGAGRADEDESSLVVRMQVAIDGESWYDRELDLAEQSHGFIFRR